MANLVELFDNIVQMQNLNGVPLAAGKLYVYALGRTRLMDSWSDVDGESLNPNPIILDDAGQAHVYVSDDFDYTLVVCDQYNNEIFSLDKYLYSKGSHSHADVAVAPSESIAVSSYHVGETTVYVPYLTGQLGKVYEGIDPIVVNNVEDKISANHVPLGVQDPLYFVQDDEEACIIGFSGETLPEGTMNESAFGYQDGQITSYNGSAFSAGNSYEAGSYIDIDGNTINVTGLQPAGNYQSAGDYVSASELENLQPKGDYYSASNPSGFITGVDLTDYAKTEDLTAYQPVGDYYSASNPSGFINSDAISSMATTGFVAGVSADITAMIPDTSDMATKTWVSSQGYLTAHQSLDGLMSADLLEFSDNKITGYNGTAFAGTTVSGDFELSAGSGISIVDYPLEQKTVISVTAQGGNPEVEQAVIDNSATWGSVTAKQDELTFGYKDTAISSIDNSALYDNSAHARITTLAGRISDLSSNKLDTTAFSDVSGTFLTAHQDLSDYQTTAGMTAYQEAGDYLTTADSANFYTTANESGFISEVPVGTMNESAFEYSGGMITAYNGSAFKAGDEFPQSATDAIGYVTATSANIDSTIDNVSSNSGAWGGSALPISAGPGIKFEMVDNTLVASTDETVLYSGYENVGNDGAATYNLTELPTNFNKIKIYWCLRNDTQLEQGNKGVGSVEYDTNLYSADYTYIAGFMEGASDNTAFEPYRYDANISNIRTTSWTQNGQLTRLVNNQVLENNAQWFHIYKVIGINRKQ